MHRLKLIILILVVTLNLYSNDMEYTKILKPTTKMLPTSIAVTEGGEVFVVDGFTGSIVKYSAKWRYRFTLKLKGVNSIVDLFTYGEHIYALSGERKLFRFNSEGIVDFYREYPEGNLLGELSKPTALYIQDDVIYISDSGNARIQSFNIDGSINNSFGYKTYNTSGFIYNSGISMIDGKFLVADQGTQEVKVFDKDGFYETSLKDGSNSEFSFIAPEDIFVDRDNTIYVVDSGSNQVSIYTEEGNLTKIGTKGTRKTEFYLIRDIWVDDNYIYVVDSFNEKVKILDKETYKFVKQLGASNFTKLLTFGAIIVVLILLLLTLQRIKAKKGDKRG